MNNFTNWKPRPSDIEWTQRWLNRLNEGGHWLIPHNKTIWKLDRAGKTLHCIHGPQDEDFRRIALTCNCFGYKAPYSPAGFPQEKVDELFIRAEKEQRQHHPPLSEPIIVEHLYGTGKSIEHMLRPARPDSLSRN